MPVPTKIIKQKMASVKNIKKITKAMEMISVSKMRKSIQKHNDSDEFAETALNLLERVALNKELTHPYLEGRINNPTSNKVLLLIIASNKGLCGGYNMNVSKRVTRYIQEHPDHEVDAIIVGKQAAKIARRNAINIIASFTEYSEYFSASEVRSVMYSLYETFDNNEDYQSIIVCYTQFFSSLSYKARALPLVPLSLGKSRDALHLSDTDNSNKKALYQYEPNEQEVLNTIVPRILMTIVYQTLLDSIASEHSARVTAMKSASDNAGELLDDLTINYNRARQAGITQEIAEIVGGSSAVSQ